MEFETTCSRLERACHFVVGLTVLFVSYSATLFAAHFLVTRL
ncbi:MAG: hypothetical protein WBD40_02260 [Tepidisphaeraceae bacterium]